MTRAAATSDGRHQSTADLRWEDMNKWSEILHVCETRSEKVEWGSASHYKLLPSTTHPSKETHTPPNVPSREVSIAVP